MTIVGRVGDTIKIKMSCPFRHEVIQKYGRGPYVVTDVTVLYGQAYIHINEDPFKYKPHWFTVVGVVEEGYYSDI